jgi:hypothetical protein
MSAAADEQIPGPPDNRLRTLVAALVSVEALLLVGGAVFLLVESVASARGNRAAELALAAIAIVVGAALAGCVRGVLRGLRWARGPVLTWQLLQAFIGMQLSRSSDWWAGVLLLVAALVVGVLIAGRLVIPQTSDRF